MFATAVLAVALMGTDTRVDAVVVADPERQFGSFLSRIFQATRVAIDITET